MLFTNTEYNNVCACCDAILRMCIMIGVGPLESDLPRASNVLRPALREIILLHSGKNLMIVAICYSTHHKQFFTCMDCLECGVHQQ